MSTLEKQFQELIQRDIEVVGKNTYKYFDPGLSLASLLSFKPVEENKLIHLGSAASNILTSSWVQEKREPAERILIIPVPDLFDCRLGYQMIRLEQDRKAVVPCTGTVIVLLIAHYLKTNEWLIERHKHIRTCDTKESKRPTDPNMGITISSQSSYCEISSAWTGASSECVGVAAELPS